MKYGVILTAIFLIIFSAYQGAQDKLSKQTDLSSLRLGMTMEQLEESLGSPYSRDRNELTYVLEDSSQLYISLRDDRVTSALVKFHHPIKIEDPQMRQLTLVQMNSDSLEGDRPSWFFAGKPEEGQIYKITQNGEVESITWVPPFTYGANQPKNLQALLQDFRSRHLKNL